MFHVLWFVVSYDLQEMSQKAAVGESIKAAGAMRTKIGSVWDTEQQTAHYITLWKRRLWKPRKRDKSFMEVEMIV